jgi:hypothetical protein
MKRWPPLLARRWRSLRVEFARDLVAIESCLPTAGEYVIGPPGSTRNFVESGGMPRFLARAKSLNPPIC